MRQPWCVIAVSLLLYTNMYAIASEIEGSTIFLERGSRGIVPCPPIATGKVAIVETDAVYWYFRQVDRRSLLISQFGGIVAPKNGIPEGVYDINRNSALVIANVTDATEGIYFYTFKPRLRLSESGNVSVAVKVSPKDPFPNVPECTQRISESKCEALTQNDTLKPRLTCVVRNVKPAVALRWLHVYNTGETELITDNFAVQPVVLSQDEKSQDWFWINNTFTTSASIPISASCDYDRKYICEAYGDALGDKNGSQVTVTFSKFLPTQETSGTRTATAEVETPSIKPTDKNAQDGSRVGLIVLGIAFCLAFVVCIVLGIIICKQRKKNNGSGRVDDGPVTDTGNRTEDEREWRCCLKEWRKEFNKYRQIHNK